MNIHIRKTISRIIIAAFIITNILSAFPSITFAASAKQKPKVLIQNREKSELIIQYNDDSKATTLNSTVKNKLKLKKLDVKRKFKKNKIELLEIDKNDDINKVAVELRKDKNVKYVQPNYPLQISALPSDPMFGKQWGLLNNGQSVEGLTGRSNVDVNALNAWNITQGSSNVIIGVLDSGVDINHEDLKDNVVPGWDFINNDETVFDSPELDVHGTQVAGIISASANGKGISGVAPKVKIMPLKFVNGTVGYTSEAIEAIQYAMEHNVKIINCSFSGSDNNAALKDAMLNSGILFVCAAGNRGADTDKVPAYPASFNLPNIISVAALDSKGVLSNFSSYGKDITIAAPGVNILATTPGNTYDYISGTSASAPFVAGEAGLLKSYLPSLSVSQIVDRIKQNAVPCTNLSDKTATGGRVDIYAALTNTKPQTDNFEGPGNDVDTVPPGQDGGNIDTWYTQDQLSKIKGRIHYGESGVNPGSGNYSFTVNDMSIAAPGFTVNLSRTYNSCDEKTTPFSRGWTFGFEGSAKGSDLVTVILPTGAVQRFRQNADNSYSAEDSRSNLVKNTDNTYVLTTKDQYTYGFNSNGWLNWMKDRNGNTVNITIDAYGKVSKITDTVGREYKVNYNGNGQIDSISDVTGRTAKYEYDSNNRLSTVTDPMGGKMYYEYDGYGYLNKIKDHNGNALVSLTYNHADGENMGKVTQAIDGYGDTVNYAYDTLNRKTTLTNKNGRVSTYWFDSSFYTIKVQDPEGRCELTEYYYYDGKNTYGDILSTTDRNGNVTKFNLDSRGNVIRKIYYADNSINDYIYDDKNNLISEKDGNGYYTYYIFDQNKINLLKKVQPLNGTDPFTDGTSNPSNYAVTTYSYYSKAEAESQFSCPAEGLLRSVADPGNNITVYSYDKDGNVRSVTDPENNTTTSEYNRIGWKTAQISSKGVRTEFAYDQNGQVIKTTIANGKGETSRTVYDLLGRKTQEISPNQYNSGSDGLTTYSYYDNTVGTRYEYYSNGLLKVKTDPENNKTSYTYDIYGNVLTKTQPNGSVYRYGYDVMDRLVKIYFKENESAQEVLLSENSYAILDNGKTQKTETRYLNSSEKAVSVTILNYAGRVVEQQNPDGTKVRTSYNPNGTVNNTTGVNGGTSYFRYDGLNRLTEQWMPFEVSNGNTFYTYTKFEYDKAGNKSAEKAGIDKVALFGTPQNVVVKNYAYYKNGKLKNVTDSQGRKNEYAYDADGNMIKEDIYTDGANKKTTEYDYNHLGKVAQKKVHVRAGDIYSNDPGSSSDALLSTTYSYDLNGNVKTVTDPRGIVTTNTYDNLNRQTSVSQPGVDENNKPAEITVSTAYYYDEDKPVATVDANGNKTTYTYNQRGLLTKVVNAKNGVTVYDYDLACRKIAEVSPKNYDSSKSLDQMSRTQYLYDNMDRVKAKLDIYLDPDTKQFITLYTRAYTYDNSGNVIKEIDAKGYRDGTGTTLDEKISTGHGTETTYNLVNKPVTVLDAVSKQRGLPYTIKYNYDALGRKTSETNAKGVITIYAYDSAGNVINVQVRKNINSSAQTIQTNTYDLANRKKTQTDGNGATISYTYTAFDKVATIVHPGDSTIDGNTVTCQYDENGGLKTQKDSMGRVDTYVYDNQGRILSHVQNAITTSTRYDKNGNKRFETDGNGIVKESTYDQLNRMIGTSVTVSGVLHTTTYEYDANGNQTGVTDWRGNTNTNVYDPLNRLIEKHDPYTTIQKLKYTVNSLQSESTDARGNTTIYSYDNNGRLISTTDPEGHTTSQAYDNLSNIEAKTDGRGQATTYSYDEFNRLKNVYNPKGEITSYTYDLNGNMLTQTDGNGNTIVYQYNVGNKLIRKIDPNGSGNSNKTESYTYYGDGSLKTKTDRNSKTTSYAYDLYGRLMSQSNSGNVISFTYDNNGNQLTVTDNTGITARTYDELGRVLSKNAPNIGKTVYAYDILNGESTGNVGEKSTDPKGNITLKEYDRADRLLTVTSGGKTTSYEYYGNGSRKSVLYPNGSKEEYTYYKDNLNKTLVNTKGDGTVIDSYGYTYDGAHNQTSKTDRKGVTAYKYDSLNRLDAVTEPNGRVTSYKYDKAGNRISETVALGTQSQVTSYTYNDQNRLIKTIAKDQSKTEKVVYTYDSSGNMTSKSKVVVQNTPTGNKPGATGNKAGEGTENNQSIFRYDEWNQLVKSIENKSVCSYAYNGEGYRVQKTVNGTLTRYLYEADKVVLEVDGAGNQTARNVYGTNLLMRSTGGDTLYYMYNGHADVTALLKTDGTTAQTYYYDAFGTIIEQSGNVNNNITYAGYQYDSETGLYYLNARMYDSKIARFLQEDTYTGDPNDPLSLNLYTYCYNNPLIYFDPTGHACLAQEQAARLIQQLDEYRVCSLVYDIASQKDPSKYKPVSIEQRLEDQFAIYQNNNIDYRNNDAYKEYSKIVDAANNLKQAEVQASKGGVSAVSAQCNLTAAQAALTKAESDAAKNEQITAGVIVYFNSVLSKKDTNKVNYLDYSSMYQYTYIDKQKDKINKELQFAQYVESKWNYPDEYYDGGVKEILGKGGIAYISGEGIDRLNSLYNSWHSEQLFSGATAFVGVAGSFIPKFASGQFTYGKNISISQNYGNKFNAFDQLEAYGYIENANLTPVVKVGNNGQSIVYRVIRTDEDPANGITAKNPNATYTAEGHVINGSKPNFKSQYISTTTDINVAKQWATKDGCKIVTIDLKELPWGTKVIDLSTEAGRAANLKGVTANNFASKSSEVLIVGYIPPNAIK